MMCIFTRPATHLMPSKYYISRIMEAIAGIQTWIPLKRIRLNSAKTQFIWFGSQCRLSDIDLTAILTSFLKLGSFMTWAFFWTRSRRWPTTSIHSVGPALTNCIGLESQGIIFHTKLPSHCPILHHDTSGLLQFAFSSVDPSIWNKLPLNIWSITV